MHYETVIFGTSNDYGERIEIVRFKSKEIPDFVLKRGWYIVWVDGKADFCISESNWTDYDIIPLD